ncbi:2Fe-2S iron-sulfur cluster-binding protein [Terrarubrum flagellatum]|uniref:2Fe-2S iron-sulfur cluster-binding protein n=1 Tax=Terrirubrum flagellatum TaxID=2895980 RepID=UPI003144D8E6
MTHRVLIPAIDRALEVGEEQTILEVALASGVAYPHGCRRGRCGSCKSRLIEGEVDLLPHTPFSLTEADKQNGLILACRARPRSDCSVAWLNEPATQTASQTA